MSYHFRLWQPLPALVAALCVVTMHGASAQRGFGPPPPASPPAPVQSQQPSQGFQQSQNPVCQRLEMQLASIERGGGDSRSEAIRRNEQNASRAQADLDRLAAQQRRLGCQSAGIFSIFVAQPPQCQSLNAQVDQARSAVDRAMSDLQRSQMGGGNDLESQRQSVITALAQNNCGPQYRAAAAQPRGIFETIFGGGASGTYGGVDLSQGGTFRTLCVRTCDGYYYPVSFATSPSHFYDDEQTCRATCPNAEVVLFSHRTNEDVRSAATNRGQRYIDLPNAFRYRTNYDASCSCRKPGQSWAEAVGENRERLGRGDIIVTDEQAKQMSAPRGTQPPRAAQQGRPGAAPPAPAPAPVVVQPDPGAADRPIRSVGPAPFPVR
jgi:hypothetical protein